MRKAVLLLVLSMVVSLCACKPEKTERIPPTRSTDPILDFNNGDISDKEQHTPVYVTIFGDTAYLSIYPREKDGEKEPECDARDISKGGTVTCSCTHAKQTPIVRVVILDEIHPDSTADWFRNMGVLRVIEGLGNLRVENVTDMSNMFNGCGRLSELNIEGWDVSNVQDMTGMFDGCDALGSRPQWYEE